MFGKAPTHDDWLRVCAADEEIVLFFTQERAISARLDGEAAE